MLCENCVVSAVAVWLRAEGFAVGSSLTTKQRGVDIRAEKNGVVWEIEAKGGTSSFAKSARYNKPFTPNQFVDRVMKGVFTAIALGEGRRSASDRVSLAMPENTVLRCQLGKVSRSLSALRISVLWVRGDGSVIHDQLS